MPSFTDQTGRVINMDQIPKRIVSLVPSQTELLYTLGLSAEVAGITKFCVHPDQWFRNKTRIGGTKDIRPDRIHSLQPDLILANKEENVKEQVEELALHYPVWVSHIHDLADALDMIRSVGTLTGKEAEANTLATEIARRFRSLAHGSSSPDAALPQDKAGPSRVAYFIWRKPWMVAGGDTFINDMLEKAGYINVFRDQRRYPVIECEQLRQSGCENILLSSEPYPFRERHISEIREILPNAHIRLVDGEMFSWYGSRLLHAPGYFRELRGLSVH